MHESNSYLILILISSILAYSYLLKDFLSRKKYYFTEVLFFFIPLIILINTLIAFLISDVSSEKFIYQYILFVIPASFIGLTLGRSRSINSIVNILLFVCILISTSSLISIPRMLTLSTRDLITFFGGGHYQSFSYTISFAFIVILLKFFFYSKKQMVIINLLYFMLLSVQILSIVISGGRGGFVVILLSTITIIFLRFKKLKATFIVFSIIIISFLSVNLFLYYGSTDKDRVLESSGRLLSYVSGNGIDMGQTSNRDLFFYEALNIIKKKPILGSGMFRNQKTLGHGFYAHNLFLDILIQGGIIYLMLWLFVLFLFFRKLRLIIKYDNHQIIILAPILYSFTQLMFSGTYLLEPFFWFSLSYVFVYPFNRIG